MRHKNVLLYQVRQQRVHVLVNACTLVLSCSLLLWRQRGRRFIRNLAV